MTPTLLGRWQTRILLMETVGLLITLLFCAGVISPGGVTYFWVLQYVTLLGLGWDVLYIYLQQYRWDQDWPAALQWLAAFWEGLFIVLVLNVAQIPLPGVSEFDLGWFFAHYSLIWVGVFMASQSMMRILFPRWRFRGGQWF